MGLFNRHGITSCQDHLGDAKLYQKLSSNGELTLRAYLWQDLFAPWEKLEEYLKDSNRDQADHNLVKESIFEQKGITRKQAIVLGVNHPDLFELMAKIEHRRWMASTVITGYRYGTDRVDNKRTHPNLQNPELSFEEHYAQLDNGIKEYDRAMIRKFIHNWDPK